MKKEGLKEIKPKKRGIKGAISDIKARNEVNIQRGSLLSEQKIIKRRKEQERRR